MTLAVGTRLGPYEVISPLGAGGMGEVYRAHDARLGREVAIKVLPADLSGDASRLKRFEKEARSASALNHPNIVTVYDIGTTDGISWIAMERVEGETLRKVLMGGALAAKKLLPIAAQIADGLAMAHEAGIVHRDLKPENMMVTKDGRVKILDFGLAKLTGPVSGSDEGSHLPTETGTSPGMLVGTAGYMSPEQASGSTVDFRSDQFSFGSILYEMATGRRAFQKKTGVDTLAAILNDEPQPIATSGTQVPAPLRWIVGRCLAKDPEDRYVSTKDLARDLRTVSDHLSEAGSSEGMAAGLVSSRRSARWVAVTAVAAAAVALGALGGKQLSKSRVAAPPRFQQVTFQKANINRAVLAPDGQTIVYSARGSNGRLELFQTRPGSRGSRSLGILDSLITSISSSGEMALIQENDRALTIAPLGGGEPRPLVANVGEVDWAPDGKTLAILRGPAEARLEFPIGTLLYEPAEGRIRVSPRGDQVLFKKAGGRLATVDREKNVKSFAEDAHEFAWSPDGEEIWFTRITNGSTHLFAVTLAGRERPLVSLPGDFTFYDVSRDGRALFERGFEQWQVFGRFPGDEREHSYRWLDSTVAQDLSADGSTLLFMEKEPGWKNAMSYIRKTDGSAAVPLGEGFCRPLSPDTKWAVCRSELRAPSLKLVSTSGETRNLPNGGLEFKMRAGRDWLPDGKRIVFSANAPGRPSRLYIQSIDGSPPTPITPEGVEMVHFGKAVSPDGKFVVGVRDGLAALYPLAGGSATPIPGLSAGDSPMQWSADGRSLYFRTDETPYKIWLLNLSTGGRRLFKEVPPPEPGIGPGGAWQFNLFLTPDGQHYVGSYQGFLADLFVLDGLK